MLPEVAPTTVQRWIARHRSRVRAGIVAVLVLVAAASVRAFTDPGGGPGSRVALGVLAVVTCTWFVTTSSICRSVDDWDARHREPAG